jgi:hypothetical protein
LKESRAYKDQSLAIRNHKLSFFDVGRELHALLSLLYVDSRKLIWQHRSIMDRLLMLIRGSSININLVLDVAWAEQITDVLTWHFYDQLNARIVIKSLPQVRKFKLDRTAFGQDVYSSSLNKSIWLEGAGARNIFSEERNSINIACLSITSESSYRLISKSYSLPRAFIFIENYCQNLTKIPIEELRRRNLSVAESADGFGELVLNR